MNIPRRVIALLLIILMPASLVSFTAFSSQDQALYAMYVNDSQVGIVKYAAKGLAYYDAVMEKMKDKYPRDVTIISKVYFKEANSNAVPTSEFLITKAIEDAVEIQTTAYAITIDNQIFGYVRSLADAESIVNAIKKPYVDEILSREGSRLDEVNFAEEVSFNQVTIDYKQLTAADEILTQLQQNQQGITEHVVQKGDSIWNIAVSNNMSVEEVLALNPDINPERLKPGDVVVLSKEQKLLNVVTKETIVYEEQIPFKEEKRDDNTLLKGKTKILQEGKKGIKEVEVQIVRENGIVVSRQTIKETIKEEPVNKIILVGTKKPAPTTSRGSSPSPTTKPSNPSTPPKQDPPPPSNGSVTGADIVEYAKKFLGRPYVYGANGPNAFDCSGFTCYVYKHFGYSLYRRAKDQALNGTPISKSELAPGDLVLFNDPYHVGIYIGGGNFIHASSGKNMKVVISSLDSGRYPTRYYGARRILK